METMKHHHILPEGWPKPKGYSNGILAGKGRILFMAGQVGWNEEEQFVSEQIAPQFEQAIRNILAIVGEAGGSPTDICRMTCFCKDRQQYLESRKELGLIWKKLMGDHYPCMSMIFVTDLLDHPAVIEIEATAVVTKRKKHKD
ncbi:MAG: RidA family protein [Bacteroidetes bacterium]|jgi:enamine deaminase RidA (YjgF/YER057c/UK114 family)|nr:RidA family protein [Bacteroidota bacterium]